MSEPVIRLNRALEGRYEVERELGQGGMATVYLADDLKHGRKVALKVLKPELAAVVGADRFISEIRTTANLQHPHILPLFDSGEADGFLFYVMPYVEGETLRDRLDRDRQLPVDEAVRLATDVADALHAAHQQGVVHRDIKPANILLSRGRPLVADFGIALAVSTAGSGRLTETGLSMGTPYYMSPEQASADRDPTAASDVYSLGCVLYEMLVGEPPYVGGSAQAVLARILTEEPRPATATRPSIPANVDAALRKALEKLPADRFPTAEAFAAALADPGFRHGVPAGTDLFRERSPWNRLSLVTTGIAMLALAVAGWALAQRSGAAAGVTTRTSVDVPDVGDTSLELAISPDGAWLAGVWAAGDGVYAIHVRAADDPRWRRLESTDGASSPAFSPSGEWIVFTGSGGGLMKVPVVGGAVLSVTSPESCAHRDPHWAELEKIVFLCGRRVLWVDDSGGSPTPLHTVEGELRLVQHPHLLPGGEGLLYTAWREQGDSLGPSVVAADLRRGLARTLVEGAARATLTSSGHLVYHGPQGVLMGAEFDVDALELRSAPLLLVPDVGAGRFGQLPGYAISESGTLVYDRRLFTERGQRRLVEVSLAGVEATVPLRGSVHEPRYSPSGRLLAYTEESTVRVFDLVSGENRELGQGYEPKWSNDGAFVYFVSRQSGALRRRTDRSSDVEVLTEQTWWVTDVAPGDSVAVARRESRERGWDLYRMHLREAGVEFEELLVAEWNEVNADVSPDGRWFVYESDEDGTSRIYARSFPIPGEKFEVSSGRGIQPLWDPDGTAIYYADPPRFMAVDVTTEPSFTASEPRMLFENESYLLYDNDGSDHNWGIHPDGERFVMVAGPPSDSISSGSPIMLVTNWFEELRRRLGTD